jgi:protein-S-isoprenylcysteine O-methyltransferase Ste14
MTRVLRLVAFLGILAALLFLCAGEWRLPWFWAYFGIWGGGGLLFLATADRRLQEERLGRGSKGEGQYFRLLLAPFGLAHFVVAGLDVGRFHWSGEVPVAVQVLGCAGFALGFLFVWWSMVVNRFFVPAIRVGEDEGHHVVTTGPYALVRHPGYLGMAVAFLCSGLALGSFWSVLPVVGYVLLLVWRTAREDTVLQAKLPGYTEYARRVRYRLVPGVW